LNSPLSSTSALPAATSTVRVQGDIPQSVLNSFGNNPETGRNFTWETLNAAKESVIEFCEKDKFKGFDQNNISKKTARSYSAKMSSGARTIYKVCLLYTSPSPRDRTRSRMPSSA
jgi:hypothetical protein